MSELSDYLATAILNYLKGSNMPAAPGSVYVAVYNGDPGSDGTGGTDVTDDVSSDGREAVTFGSISNRAMSNSADVEYGPSESAVSITHFGLWDAASGGNFIGGDALQTSRSVSIGDPVSFLAGDLSVSFTYA